jgi:hypothetical protein
MRQLYRIGAEGVVVLVALVLTIVGAALPASSEYHEAVYPKNPGSGDQPGSGDKPGGKQPGGGDKPGGNNPGGGDKSGGNNPGGGYDPASGLANALKTAALRWSFSSSKLTQYVPTRFTASIIYDRQASGKIILVAYENVASLRATKKKEFDIVPRTSASQRLDEGRRLPGGGYKLSWHWDITPQSAGKKTLELEIQPVIVINGSRRKGIQVRNEPIPISVRVHPNAAALDEMSSKVSELSVTHVPTELVVGQTAEITAVLPLRPYERVVKAHVTLKRGPDSVGASVSDTKQTVSAGSLIAKWSVTPTEAGTLDLVFRTALSTQAGVQRLTIQVETPHSEPVSPAPASFWSQFVGLFAGIGVVLAALVSIVSLKAALRKKRSSAASPDA